ncbi:Oidioi.mRNA.OKI2018_I69.XSR.g13317.t1.cds [Oikopleura dioica]|uniref:Oidioi.mRNA.OKI2018_I69.XSR.g13317.t1.cds n=1 Tax=Oikopleura dioica TaxID=34765 RepID=A0ABN7SB89_OIKDI|nr:Oidioi.mRNA.OKI2018_I69.XSR.g13317.t1.cds [Oikopleura dioica]
MLVIRRHRNGEFVFEERRPPQNNLLTLVIMALMFLSFQANLHRHMQAQQAGHAGHAYHERNKYGGGQQRNLHPKFHHKLEQEVPIKVNGTLLVGVRKEDRKRYLPDKDANFLCLDGKQTVKFEKVNDNNCDCEDGSDEPGTSACDYHFYCEPEHRYIRSKLVNDGVCDCCDGSDEWKGLELSEENKLPRQGENVRFTPCSDVCYDYELQESARLDVIAQGKELKEEYVKAAEHLENVEKANYGPNGEFYKLSQICLTYRSPSYVYKLCPYSEASQDDGMKANPLTLGKGGVLNLSDPNSPKLLMPNGKGDGCPSGISRSVEVNFVCGVADEISYVSEPSTCLYRFDLTTPAAC